MKLLKTHKIQHTKYKSQKLRKKIPDAITLILINQYDTEMLIK